MCISRQRSRLGRVKRLQRFVVRRVLRRLREAELLPSGKAIPEAGDRRARLKASRRRMVNLAIDENLVAMPQEDETPACSVEHALHQRVSSVLQAI